MNKVLSVLLSILLALAVARPILAADAVADQTVTLAVENMTCAACPITVRKALQRVPGVSKVTIDLDTKTATVSFDPTKAKVEDLVRATTDAGYPSRLRREPR